MADLNIDPQTTALLVMDCQEGIVGGLTPAEKEKVLTNVARALRAARGAGMPVVYVVVQFREGHPEISPRNARFSAIKQAGRLREGAPDAAICAAVSPRAGEPIAVKKRIGAFTGSDLEQILRAEGVDTLVLTGVSSLGVIESTARAGFDKDYRIITLSDCCSDSDPEANAIALQWLLPRMGTVAATADFEAALR